MKAKLLRNYQDMPAGTICEIIEDTHEKHGCDEFYDIVTPEGTIGVYKWRMELLPLSPIEEKERQISDARNTLEKLEKELADLKVPYPKVGDKYEHKGGSKWIASKMDNKFALICYETNNIHQLDLGRDYLVSKEIEGIFGGRENYFTLLS